MSFLIGGAIAFAVGALISYLLYRLNLRVLQTKPDRFASFSVVRQLVSAGYLFLVFFVSRRLPWSPLAMLLGAAFGVTIPSILLAFRLAKMNDRTSAKNPAGTAGTEEGDDARG